MSSEGKLIIPARILDTLGWDHGSSIAINYIPTPLIMLFQKVDDGSGFRLRRRATNPSSRPAGLLSCVAFAKRTLKTRVVLPQKQLMPILLKRVDYRLALILEAPQWKREEFSQAGRQNIPLEVSGVYQLLGPAGEVFRIGEGRINSRVAQHLKNEGFSEKIQALYYLSLIDKEETELVEHVLLAEYEAIHGKLPPLNLIRS